MQYVSFLSEGKDYSSYIFQMAGGACVDENHRFFGNTADTKIQKWENKTNSEDIICDTNIGRDSFEGKISGGRVVWNIRNNTFFSLYLEENLDSENLSQPLKWFFGVNYTIFWMTPVDYWFLQKRRTKRRVVLSFSVFFTNLGNNRLIITKV